MLKPEESCAKPGQDGHPISFYSSHDLTDVQKGPASGVRASNCALRGKVRERGREDSGDRTSDFSYLKVIMGERGKLILRDPLG